MRRRNVAWAIAGIMVAACGVPTPAPLQGPALVFFYTEQ